MDDLISRDYLREIVGGMPTGWEYGAAVSDIYDIIMKAPAVDAAPVTRCKDCKHSEFWYRDKRICRLWNEDGIDVFNDGFCNYGKRREEDGREG